MKKPRIKFFDVFKESFGKRRGVDSLVSYPSIFGGLPLRVETRASRWMYLNTGELDDKTNVRLNLRPFGLFTLPFLDMRVYEVPNSDLKNSKYFRLIRSIEVEG